MDVALGAPVESSDGKDAGSVDQLVVDRSTGEIQSVIVRKGTLLTHRVAIPFESTTIAGGKVRIQYTEDELDDLPEFDDRYYTGDIDVAPPAPLESPPVGYPTARMGMSVSYGTPPPPVPSDDFIAPSEERAEFSSSLQRYHLASAVIGEGSDVQSRDGEKVGEVDQLGFGADGRLTRLVVKRGFIFADNVELPASAIASIDDRLIVLDLEAADLKQRG